MSQSDPSILMQGSQVSRAPVAIGSPLGQRLVTLPVETTAFCHANGGR
ncbi:hypothetical protein SynMITS9220_01798 [Synechococcus sp. MIT S9220]|nr:hypothetical protein SynMITS9220_01798 [Synechococcus sp. MIT S9220]